jgi:hypothetical protein
MTVHQLHGTTYSHDRDADSADLAAIEDHATLLVILLAQPDADTAVPQMHRVAQLIVDHVQAITGREEANA